MSRRLQVQRELQSLRQNVDDFGVVIECFNTIIDNIQEKLKIQEQRFQSMLEIRDIKIQRLEEVIELQKTLEKCKETQEKIDKNHEKLTEAEEKLASEENVLEGLHLPL